LNCDASTIHSWSAFAAFADLRLPTRSAHGIGATCQCTFQAHGKIGGHTRALCEHVHSALANMLAASTAAPANAEGVWCRCNAMQ